MADLASALSGFPPLTLGQTPAPATPASKPAPKPVPNPSRMGDPFAPARALAAKQQAQSQAASAKVGTALDAASSRDTDQLATDQRYFDRDYAQMNAAMQRQRLLAVNRAQTMRKLIPIISIVSLAVGALADGMPGAISALGGGLAGLSQGADKQYQEGWKQFQDQYNSMSKGAHDLFDEMQRIDADRSKTIAQKVALMKPLAQRSPMLRVALAQGAADTKAQASVETAYLKLSQGRQKLKGVIDRGDAAMTNARVVNDPPTTQQVQDAMSAVQQARGVTVKKGKAAKPTDADLRDGRQVAQLAQAHQGLHPGMTYARALTDTVNFLRLKHKLGQPFEVQTEESAMEPQRAAQANQRNADQQIVPGTGLTRAAIKLGAEEVIEGKNLNNVVGYGVHSNQARHAAMNEAGRILETGGYTLEQLPALQASFSAREKALGQIAEKGASLGAYVTSLQGQMTKLRTAASAFGLNQYPAVNWARIKTQEWSGDPKVAAYQQALYDVVIDYGRVLSGATGAGGTTDSARNEAGERLAATGSMPALDAELSQITQSAAILDASFAARATSLRKSLGVMNLNQPVPKSGATTPGLPTTYTDSAGHSFTAASIAERAAASGMTASQYAQAAGLTGH